MIESERRNSLEKTFSMCSVKREKVTSKEVNRAVETVLG
jgi:hypothetical protein